MYWMGKMFINIYYKHIQIHIQRIRNHLISLCGQGWLGRYREAAAQWVSRRYWGIKDSFKSHRRIFQDQLGRYFDPGEDARNSDRDSISCEQFRDCCEVELGIDVEKFTGSRPTSIERDKYAEFRQLYPMVASVVDRSDATRAEGFQARYSFCRGMWVVLSLLIVGYTGVMYAPVVPAALDYPPLVLQQLDRSEFGLVVWFLVVLTILFVDASGDYKQNYIEYLINYFFEIVKRKQKDLCFEQRMSELVENKSDLSRFD
jgi:hypothetical protein